MLGQKNILAAALAVALVFGNVLVESQAHIAAANATITVAAASPWKDKLTANINELLADDLLQKTQAGVMVYDLTTGEVLFKSNERQLMRPASTLKLFTAVTALERLGAGYQFKTKLAYTGTISNGTLNGNVYCIGGFDPCFNRSDMLAFAESLRALGISRISGQLFADTSMINTPRWGEGWCWDDEEYNPTLAALLYNEKDNFMDAFKQVLEEYNISVSPFVANSVTPAEAQLICQRTHSIGQVMRQMLKDSDNLYAEAMFYNLAAASGLKNATAAQAKAQVNSLITQLGFNPSAYRIADGSGLSLYNYLSPELEVALLKHVYQQQGVFAQLYTALPVGGVDGTLDYRQGNIAGKVHAKTGTLTGVQALAGFVQAANGHLLAFSIMNEGILSNSTAVAFQDRLCTLLCTVQ